MERTQAPGGAGRYAPPVKEMEDISKLICPFHKINLKKTQQHFQRLQEAVGDIIKVGVDRGPVFSYFRGDIATDLAALRGLEQMMWDMYDRPEKLRVLLFFLRDGILKTHDEAETAGDWMLLSQENQAMTYSLELPDPDVCQEGVGREKLWVFMAAQEYAQVSPEMFEEFLLVYQIPILEKFGLAAYGCCEDLTHKIKHLRKIKNLRRISVTPWADTRSCAEQIGEDYVVSWRPNPAEMICMGLDPERVKKIVRKAMDDFKENRCHVDITLKDLQTVQGKPDNIKEWVEIVKEVLENYS